VARLQERQRRRPSSSPSRPDLKNGGPTVSVPGIQRPGPDSRHDSAFSQWRAHEYSSLLHKGCPSSLGGGAGLPTSAVRTLSGATALHAKPSGVCVEIVFIGFRLCDSLIHAAVVGQAAWWLWPALRSPGRSVW
jgi:hypothetical protein